MKRILSIILSFVLLLQPIAFAYSPSTRGEPVNASNRGKSYVTNEIDYSFFRIPRKSKEKVFQEEKCEYYKASVQYWAKGATSQPLNPFMYVNLQESRIHEIRCSNYKEYGVKRAEAWDTYERAYWNEDGEYWQLSPTELYDKYEEVTKDISHLWNVNPEYVKSKREDVIGKVVVSIIVTIIAIKVGAVIAPMLAEMGFATSAQMASVLPFEAKGIISPLRFAIQSARLRFWADLGITMAYMAMEGVFVESAFEVYTNLTEELQLTLQEHVNASYALKTRNLLSEINGSQLPEQDKKEIEENAEEIYSLNQELKEKVQEALKEQGWKDDDMKYLLVHRESVVTLYALEYIRAEMSDLSDPHRYREAAMDIAQVYFSNNLTNLHEARKEVYLLAKAAYDNRQAIKEKQAEAISRILIQQAFLD